MSAPNSASSVPSIIEPLHNPENKAMILEPSNKAGMEMGVSKMHLGAKGFLMKKMAAAGQSFCSPTDTMVSPCTQKLVQSKKRHYTKGKPLSLSHSFQSSQLGSQLVTGQNQENAAPTKTDF